MPANGRWDLIRRVKVKLKLNFIYLFIYLSFIYQSCQNTFELIRKEEMKVIPTIQTVKNLITY